MIVRHMRLQGFRSYGELDLAMPDGTVAVVGDNGAGKSSLMEAVAFGLFGARSGMAASDCVSEGLDQMLVELCVSHGGREFRIRRASRKGKTTIDFDVLDPADPADQWEITGSWEPLTQGNQEDTQDLIERTLAVTPSTFQHSVFLRQNQGGSFPKAGPKQRREILADALGLNVYSDAHEAVTKDRLACKTLCDELDGRINALAPMLADTDQLHAEHEQLLARIPDLEQQLRAAQDEAAAAADQLRAIERREAEHAAAATRVRELEQRSASLAEKTEMAAAAQAEIEEQRRVLQQLAIDDVALEETQHTLDQAAEQQRLHEEAVQRRDGFLNTALAAEQQASERLPGRDALVLRIEQLDQADTPMCDRCGQHVDGDALDRARESLRAEIEAHDDGTRDLETRASVLREAADAVNVPAAPDPATLTGLRARVMELAQTPAKQQAARDRIQRAETALASAPTIEEIEQARDDLVRARAELADLQPAAPDAVDDTQMRALSAAGRAREIEADLNHHRQHAAVLADRLQQALQTRATHDQAVEERAQAGAELDALIVLDQAFGPAGVPAWIVEHNAIPAIEQHANAVLDRLGGAVRRVELRTEREKKTGGVAQTLDVVCHTDDGAREFGTFSGGEQTRADIALRLGLAQLLAGRGDAARMLMLDEPGGLDAAGMEALVDVLRDMTMSGRVDTVLLASHVPALRDAFDRALIVEKVDGRSRVVAA